MVQIGKPCLFQAKQATLYEAGCVYWVTWILYPHHISAVETVCAIQRLSLFVIEEMYAEYGEMFFLFFFSTNRPAHHPAELD